MNILDKIAAHKKEEITLKKRLVPASAFERYPLFSRQPVSLKESLQKREYGIIAEHKRRSPSRAVINQDVPLPAVIRGYEHAGASGISVLTDSTFFGGSLEDLLMARACTPLPLLRKDFMLEPYQVLEAKAHGADVILLIAALLSPDQMAGLSETARGLGLEVLIEVHDAEELERCPAGSADLIGVNNRNLKTFEVSLQTSRDLVDRIPGSALAVSESGLSRPEDILSLAKLGYRGFLMGESFMKEPNPGAALGTTLQKLQL